MVRRLACGWFPLGVGMGLLHPGCVPETDEVVPMVDPGPDPCVETDADLSDGIQTGAELRAVFDCVNRTGQLDPFVPVISAMETSTISDGQTTVLDMWANILNEEIQKAQGSDISVTTSDLVAALDRVLELLNETWLPQALELAGAFLESGAVEPMMPVVGSIASELVALQDPTQENDAYDAYLEQLVNVLCPDLENQGQCVGNVQQVYRGMQAAYSTYGTDAYQMPSSQQTAELLAGLFAPQGDDAEDNAELNETFGNGIARLGQGPFLLNTLNEHLPALYGDDPTTPELEGYESYNTNQSALYALLELMADPDFAQSMKDMMNGLSPLTDEYYTWSLLIAYGSPVENGSCDPKTSEVYEEQNPAYYGLDQVLRLLKETDVDYLNAPNSDCAEYVGAALYYAEALGFELSGSTNIATLMLEIFSQLPADAVTIATDLGGIDADLLLEFNSFCGTNLVLNDYEALQASVHIDEVIVPTLEIMKVVTQAGQMEALKNLIVDLYDNHMLCEIQPWLSEVAQPGGVLDEATDLASAMLPGGPYHETILVPLLRTVVSLQGEPAQTLIPPIARGLTPVGKEIGEVVTGLGAMAYDAVTEYEYKGDPALYHMDEIMADLAAYDSNAEAIENLARTIQERTLLTGMLETVAVENVQDAFEIGYGETGRTPVEFMSDFVNNGELLDLLYLVRGLLVQMDTGIEETDTGASE